MKLFYQMLNSGVKMPTPVFAPDDETGADDQQQEEQQQEEKPAQSRFNDAGLGKFRNKEEQEDKGEQQQQEAKEKGDRPEWLLEKYKTPEDQAKAYNALYAKMRDSGKIKEGDEVPESADGYFADDFKLDDDVDRIGLLPDDPGLKVAGEVFKKYGIGKATAASIVKDMFKGMNEHAPAPMDPEQELKALGPNGKHVIDGTMVWLEKLDREGKLSDDDANVAIGLMGTAAGVRFLNKVRGMTGEMPIPTGHHTVATGGMSGEEWQEAYMKAIADGDEKEQRRLDSISASVYGNAPSSGSPMRGIANR